jgi:hypothetical protein
VAITTPATASSTKPVRGAAGPPLNGVPPDAPVPPEEVPVVETGVGETAGVTVGEGEGVAAAKVKTTSAPIPVVSAP